MKNVSQNGCGCGRFPVGGGAKANRRDIGCDNNDRGGARELMVSEGA